MFYNKILLRNFLSKRYTISIVFPIIFFLLTVGCATIPKEALELNTAVNNGINSQNAAYKNLFDFYFNSKKEKIDEWITNVYTPNYMKNIKSLMAKEGITEIKEDDMPYILKNIISKRDSMQNELEKTKNLIWTKISQDQMLLLNANEQVTMLLKSAVNVHEASKDLLQNASKFTALNFNFSKMDNIFNQYLSELDNYSKKSTSLIEDIEPLLDGEKKWQNHLKK